MKIGIIGIGNVGLQVLKDIQSNGKINKFLNKIKVNITEESQIDSLLSPSDYKNLIDS